MLIACIERGTGMADERRSTHRKHGVIMEQRERVTIQGVLDVISFDEEAVVSETEMGILVVRGANLHVSRLNLDNGELHIDGEVDVIMYEDDGFMKGGRGSFFSRLFK